MIKTTLVALTITTALSTAAAAGNVDPVQSDPVVIVPNDIEPRGSLFGTSAGAAVPIGIGLLIIAAVASSGGSN